MMSRAMYIFVILVISIVFLMTPLKPETAYAVSINETNATVTVTINTLVDVSLINITIDFGSLDPGTNDNPNINNPLRVRININTNTQTNLTMKGTGDFSSNGYSFGLGNLTYSNESDVASSISMTTSYTSPCCEFSNWINIPEPSAVPEDRDVWFWIDIPTGQTAAAYQTKVTIKTGVFS